MKKLIYSSTIKYVLMFIPSYPCEWGGVVEGKPYLRHLEDFGKAVLEDVWAAVVEQFVDVSY